MENRSSFGSNAKNYAQYRPGYPAELYEFLTLNSPGTDCAWDCACGTGQVARELSRRFTRVLARDISPEQVEQAPRAANIEYSIGAAEQSGYPDESIDLICVAQALHWFDLEAFFGECRRVLRPGGLLAVWGYGFVSISEQIDALMRKEFFPRLDGYWSGGNRLLWNRYRDIEFPFYELKPPPLSMAVRIDRRNFTRYVGTWSGVIRYDTENEANLSDELETMLSGVWPDGLEREISYDFTAAIRRKSS